MNWAALAAIAALLGVLVTIVAAAHTNGRLTQQIIDGAKRADEHTRRLDDHDDRLRENDVAIGKLEQWKDGYNAATMTVAQGRS